MDACRHLMPDGSCDICRNPKFECQCAAWDKLIVEKDTHTDTKSDIEVNDSVARDK